MFEQTTASIQEMQVEFDALITALDVFQLGDEQPKTVQNTRGPSTTPDPQGIPTARLAIATQVQTAGDLKEF